MTGMWRPRGAFLTFLVLLVGVHRVAGFTEDCPTYYVNLDKSEDRRERVERLFGGFTNLERVAGVDGHNKRAVLNVLSEDHCPPSALPNSFDEGTLGVRRGSGTYLSRLGCALSHLKAILRAHDDGREYALILEDDATPDLVPTWAGSLSDFVKTLPEDWTIVQLSALSYEDKLTDLFTQWQETRRNERAPDLTTLPKRAGSLIWSAQAYLVSREGMKKIAAKYRREDGGLDLCAASCIELDDCVLQEGVPEEGYRIATPPLFVPRQDMTSTIGQTDAEDDEGLGKVAETEGTRKMYEESRDVLYKWAGSWALNDRKSANLNMDADTLRDIMDAVLDLQGKKNSRVTTDSFKQAFHAYCENGKNGCAVEKAYLKNVVNPREVVDDDDEDVVERVESSRDSKKASKRARVGPEARSTGSSGKPRSKMGESRVDHAKVGRLMNIALLGDGPNAPSAFAKMTVTPSMGFVLAACGASALVAMVAFAVGRRHETRASSADETTSLLASAENGGGRA